MKILNLRLNTLIVLTLASLLCNACATNKEVVVADGGYKLDVEWSQTDAQAQLRMIAETMSTADWLMQYADQNRGKRPTVLVAPIRNATGQRVDSYGMQIEFERLLQNRATTSVMTGLALPDTSRMAPSLPISELINLGRSHNAEFIVLSELGARSAPGSLHLTNYQLNVELLDLRTEARVWRDVRTIRRNETLSN
jgi:PBP1b-binding outer membrane lipoprotein LpoB